MLLAYIYRSITHRVHFLDKASWDLCTCAKDLLITAMNGKRPQPSAGAKLARADSALPALNQEERPSGPNASLVARPPPADLLICAKDLFVAAMVTIAPCQSEPSRQFE